MSIGLAVYFAVRCCDDPGDRGGGLELPVSGDAPLRWRT